MEPIVIPDAELRLMEWIWKQPGLRAVDLCRLAKEAYGWTRNTTYTLLSRLIEKGVLERVEPGYGCRPLVSREEVSRSQTHALIDRLYHGSRKLFLTSFLQQERLSEEELTALQQLIDHTKGE